MIVKRREQSRIWTTNTYNRLSRYYDKFMKFIFLVGEQGRERIAKKLISGSVLDVTCGIGMLLEMAGKRGLDSYGIDLSEGMIAEAKRKIPGAEFKRAN